MTLANKPILTGLYIYPVKSCGGISVESARLDTWGLEYDRNWLVVNADNRFLTQRELPRLAIVQPALEPDNLRLVAPDMPTLYLSLSNSPSEEVEVTVWRDRCRAIDQGDEAAEWFSTFLGLACRLVRMSKNFHRPIDPDYALGDAQVNFADGYPSLMSSEASLADLNERCAASLPMNRFRPNMVVAGCQPYAEDSWHTMRIKEVTFHRVKPCQRCIITTVDQKTGNIAGRDPLQTLATYRRVKGGVIFGQNLIHTELGEVRLGDIIEVQKQD